MWHRRRNGIHPNPYSEGGFERSLWSKWKACLDSIVRQTWLKFIAVLFGSGLRASLWAAAAPAGAARRPGEWRCCGVCYRGPSESVIPIYWKWARSPPFSSHLKFSDRKMFCSVSTVKLMLILDLIGVYVFQLWRDMMGMERDAWWCTRLGAPHRDLWKNTPLLPMYF